MNPSIDIVVTLPLMHGNMALLYKFFNAADCMSIA